MCIRDRLGSRPLFGDPNLAANRATASATSTFTGTQTRVSTAFTNAILMSNTDEGYESQVTVGLERRPARGFFGKLAYTRSSAQNVNNLTSSQAYSQWRFNPVSGNPNVPELGRSNYEVRDRVLGVLSYRFDAGRYFDVRGLNTTVSLFYNGRSGEPFSYVYNGDANLDRETSNDLIYVPANQSEITLISNGTADTRTPDQIWAELDAYIEADPYLRTRRGQIAERNASLAPWTNLFDLRLSQEIPTLRGQRLELTLDVLNFGNLLNSDWGQVSFVGNNSYQLIQFAGYTATGTPQFRFSTPSRQFRDENGAVQETRTGRDAVFTPSDLASRWQMQLGVRYTF